MALPKPTPGAIAVITGASAGIGEALARGLAARGHDLLLVARRLDRLDAIAGTIRTDHGVWVDSQACDLADRDAREKFRDRLRERDVSILCNNAGFATFGDLRHADPDREREQLELNAVAVQDLTLAVLPNMISRGGGAILITGSTAGHQPFPGNATYAASKAFANTFAESLHKELSGTAVTCTLLAPGPVSTEFNQVAGIDGAANARIARLSVSADDVADQALRGLERGARVVIPGCVAKLETIGGRYTPRSVLLPVLHRVSRVLS
jgi:short-subunit dehydrogenase